ncbi:MAG: hypothetical protein KZQ70_12055 [gamma proteobacterium symbiont of Lucinoma myriamae]|nr:hypothetical protein [gamma proteobacterium symbiont of Lucinoma myriamae]
MGDTQLEHAEEVVMNISGNNIEQYYSSCLYKKTPGSKQTNTPSITILVADDQKRM